MTFAFIALNPSRSFIPRITFQSVRSNYFLSYLLESLIQSCCLGERSYLTDYVLPRKFIDSERWEQVFIILFSVARFTLFI